MLATVAGRSLFRDLSAVAPSPSRSPATSGTHRAHGTSSSSSSSHPALLAPNGTDKSKTNTSSSESAESDVQVNVTLGDHEPPKKGGHHKKPAGGDNSTETLKAPAQATLPPKAPTRSLNPTGSRPEATAPKAPVKGSRLATDQPTGTSRAPPAYACVTKQSDPDVIRNLQVAAVNGAAGATSFLVTDPLVGVISAGVQNFNDAVLAIFQGQRSLAMAKMDQGTANITSVALRINATQQPGAAQYLAAAATNGRSAVKHFRP